MKKDRSVRQLKKVYQKPEMARVKLLPEEAVLGNCKETGSSGPPGVANCNLPLACAVDGS